MLLNPLIVSLFPRVFTHLLLWSNCWGITGSRWLHVLPSPGLWAVLAEQWQWQSLRKGSLPCWFFFPHLFSLCTSPPDAGSWARKPFILRCEGYAWAPMEREDSRSLGCLLALAAQRHCCSHPWSLLPAAGVSQTVQRWKPLLSCLCSIRLLYLSSSSSSYGWSMHLGILPQLD